MAASSVSSVLFAFKLVMHVHDVVVSIKPIRVKVSHFH